MKKIVLALLTIIGTLKAQAGVVVYIPSTQSPAAIEKKVKALTGDSVTVFAKYGDFEAAVEALKPDVVISTDAFAKSSEGFTSAGTLKVNGSDKSKMIVLALDQSWKTKKLTEARIGAVEFIKRNKVKDYLQEVFGSDFKGVKTVSKLEDLFPLLVFKSVDLIALEPYAYEELKEKFNTQVFEVNASKEFPALTLFNKGGAEVKKDHEQLKQFDYSGK